MSINILGSAGDISVIDGDINPGRKMVLVGNYQIADGDALRTEEAVAETPPDSAPAAAEGQGKSD